MTLTNSFQKLFKKRFFISSFLMSLTICGKEIWEWLFQSFKVAANKNIVNLPLWPRGRTPLKTPNSLLVIYAGWLKILSPIKNKIFFYGHEGKLTEILFAVMLPRGYAARRLCGYAATTLKLWKRHPKEILVLVVVAQFVNTKTETIAQTNIPILLFKCCICHRSYNRDFKISYTILIPPSPNPPFTPPPPTPKMLP